MASCPYLLYEPSDCVKCIHWFCTSTSRRKKLSDTSMCVDEEEWIECPRYLKEVEVTEELEPEPEEEVIELPPTEEVTAISGGDLETFKVTIEPEPVEVQVPPPTPSRDCPYFGPIPAGKKSSSGFWCHAKNVPLRSYKICQSPPSWRSCQRRQGVN